MAFPFAKPAKTMLKTILSMEKHKHPLVVEQIDEAVLFAICKNSSQPVILFAKENTLELDVSSDAMSMQDAVFYLENKYRYH